MKDCKFIDFHIHYMPNFVSGDEILRKMDVAGIEKSVVLAIPDHPRYSGMGHTGTNEEVEQLVRLHPDRLVGGVYIDPRATMNAQTTARKYRDKGFPLVKIWPGHGFYMDDPQIYPVWETVNELEMGVLFHSGLLGARSKELPLDVIRSASFNSKYGQPIYLDQPARLFPDIQFIIAHSAYPWTLEALELARTHPNVFIDFSCPSGFEGYNLIRRIQPGHVPWHKFLWGSDSAGGGYAEATEQWLELAETSPLKEHAEDFFHNNAEALLGKIMR